MKRARRTNILVQYDGADITDDVSKYLLEFTYTDNTQDNADEIQLKFHDREGYWRGSWYPKLAASSDDSGSETGSSSSGSSSTKSASSEGSRRIDFPSGFEDITLSVTGAMVLRPFRLRIRDFFKRIFLDISDIMQDGWNGTVSRNSSSGSKTSSSKTSSQKGQSGGGGHGVAGSIVEATIVAEGEGSLFCGSFEVDAFSYEGPPDTATMKAVSVPIQSSLRREKKNQAWEFMPLSKIAADIASGAGLSLVFEVEEDTVFDRIEQRQEADLPFLQRLCKDNGVSLKVTDGQIVLFEEQTYEQRDSIATITYGGSNILSYQFEQSNADCVQSSTVQYKDPKSGKLVQETFTPSDPPAVEAQDVASVRPADLSGDELRESVAGSTNLNVKEDYGSVRADAAASAYKKAKSRARELNRTEFTHKCTLRGDTRFVGGVTYEAMGFGVFDGKYMVDTAVHTVSSSGYTTEITSHRCLEGY